MRAYFDQRGLETLEVQLLLFELPAQSRKACTWVELDRKAEDMALDLRWRKVAWQANQWVADTCPSGDSFLDLAHCYYLGLIVHESFLRAFRSPRYVRDRAEFDKYMKRGQCWVCHRFCGHRTENGHSFPAYIGGIWLTAA